MAGKQQNAAETLSFKLGDFAESGLLPDGRYLLKKNEVMTWDYDGKVAGASTCCLKVVCQPITVDAKGKITEAGNEIIHYASAGDPTRIGPNADGTGFVAISAKALAKDSNFYKWLESIVKAGFSEDGFDNDVTVFDNMAVEVVNVAAPKRNIQEKSNLVQAGPPRQQREDKTIPLVSVIGKMPGEKVWSANAGSAAASAPAAGKPAAAAATTAATKVNGAAKAGNSEDTIKEVLAGILNGQSSMDRGATRLSAYKALGAAGLSNDDRKKALEFFNDDAALNTVLETVGDGFTINEGNIVPLFG